MDNYRHSYHGNIVSNSDIFSNLYNDFVVLFNNKSFQSYSYAKSAIK